MLAGAGSGKTRALTHKIAYLVSRGIPPWRILAVTFTNKAAREMLARVGKLLAMPTDGLWIGTFHGICVRILRREADRWGFRRDFTIYDRDDQTSVVKRAMRDLNIPNDRLKPRQVISHISRAKNDFVSPEGLSERLKGPDAELICSVYERYGKLLRDADAFDFDDLLIRPVEMFTEHPDHLEDWRRRFDHVLVDEYQDTNRTQYELVRLLCGDKGTVTVVGDDDQSIYSWRGADIRNILEFEKDFKGVRTIRLEQNYRSTGIILKASNAVVANNAGRMSKKLWTDRGDGDKIRVLECGTDRDEAERVVETMLNDRRRAEIGFRDCVVLYRTNAQSRSFEEVLRRRGIRYVIVGGLRFYDRAEIKDLLAYLKTVVNPGDYVSFTRAVTNPKRGVGDKTLADIERFATDNGFHILDALARMDEFLSGATLQKVGVFYDLIRRLYSMRGEEPIAAICRRLIEEIDFREYLKKEHADTWEERWNNIEELVAAMAEYENPDEDDDLATFLGEVALMTDVDTWDDDEDAVTLMTMHAAKGLEFKAVFIAGVERGLFPLPQSFESTAELEEERRLFYVGMTRAEDMLRLSYALMRGRYGGMSGGASMFISEIPTGCVEYETADIPRPPGPAATKRITRTMEFEDYSQETPDAQSNPFAVGMWVTHPRFGRGKVSAMKGSGENLVLTITFRNGTKQIMPHYVRLAPA